MKLKQEILDQLQKLREKDKFSESDWQQRGLHASDEKTNQEMNTLINECIDTILQTKKSPKSRWQEILIASLTKANYNEAHFDTEEKEFLCNYFSIISKLVNVDLRTDLNEFLYGPDLAMSIMLSRMQPKEYKVRSQKCENCQVDLETLVIEQAGIPEYSWLIVECEKCKEYNLLSPGEDIKEMKFGNYKYIEQLRKDEYSFDQARQRIYELRKI
jgi:hypothetical protein